MLSVSFNVLVIKHNNENIIMNIISNRSPKILHFYLLFVVVFTGLVRFLSMTLLGWEKKISWFKYTPSQHKPHNIELHFLDLKDN